MDRPITRRDFLNGHRHRHRRRATCDAALVAGAADGHPAPASAPAQDAPGYYPPLLTGMRGSHPGSFEAAHALRDGQPLPAAAGHRRALRPDRRRRRHQRPCGRALLPRAARPARRILILDNHDDFGGHAKRNEFDLGRPAAPDERRHAGDRQPAALQPGRRRPAEDPGHRRRRSSSRPRQHLAVLRSLGTASAASSSTARPSAPTSWWSASAKRRSAQATRAGAPVRAGARANRRARDRPDRLPAGLTSDEKKNACRA